MNPMPIVSYVYWNKVEDELPEVGKTVLVYGVADAAPDGTGWAVATDRLSYPTPVPGWTRHDAVTHWADIREIDPPEE